MLLTCISLFVLFASFLCSAAAAASAASADDDDDDDVAEEEWMSDRVIFSFSMLVLPKWNRLCRYLYQLRSD